MPLGQGARLVNSVGWAAVLVYALMAQMPEGAEQGQQRQRNQQMNWCKSREVEALKVANEKSRYSRAEHQQHKGIACRPVQCWPRSAATSGPERDRANRCGANGAAHVKGDQRCQLHGAALSQVLACTVLLGRDGRERLAMNGRCRGVKCRWIA